MSDTATRGKGERVADWGRRLRRPESSARRSLLLILKSALAATVSWFVSYELMNATSPAFAPFSAVLMVQVTVYQSVVQSLRYVGAVAAGVAVQAVLGLSAGPDLVTFALVALVALVHQPLAAAGRPGLPGRHRRLLRLRHVHRRLQRHRPGQGAGPDRAAGPHRLRRRRRRQRADRPAPALPQRRVGHPRPGPGDPRPARHHGAGAGRGRPRRGHHPGLAGPRGPHRHPDLPVPRGPAHRPREPAPQPPPLGPPTPGHPHLRGVRPDHGGAGPDDLPGHRDHPQPRPAAPGRKQQQEEEEEESGPTGTTPPSSAPTPPSSPPSSTSPRSSPPSTRTTSATRPAGWTRPPTAWSGAAARSCGPPRTAASPSPTRPSRTASWSWRPPASPRSAATPPDVLGNSAENGSSGSRTA